MTKIQVIDWSSNYKEATSYQVHFIEPLLDGQTDVGSPVGGRQLLVPRVGEERHLAAGERNSLKRVGGQHEAVVAEICIEGKVPKFQVRVLTSKGED